MSVILVDRIGAVVFHNGVLRIDCIATGPNGEDRPAGTLLLPLNQAGAVLRSLIGAAQEVDRRLREQIRQAAAAQGASRQAAAQTTSGQTTSEQAAPAGAASTPATPEAIVAHGAEGGVEPAAASGNGGAPRAPARPSSRSKRQPS